MTTSHPTARRRAHLRTGDHKGLERPRGRKLALETLEDRRLLSSLPHLLKDISTGTDSITWWPRNGMGELKGEAYFTNGGGDRWELWKSNGTPEGTVLLTQMGLAPGESFGTDSGEPRDWTTIGSTLYFTAADPAHGREFWKTDGTPQGTRMVSDLNPGLASAFGSSYGTNLCNVNGRLFLAADDGTPGSELWVLDAPGASPRLVRDIGSQANASTPVLLANVNGVLAFAADDGTHGLELWRSDGALAGTWMVKDINDHGSAGSMYAYGNYSSGSTAVVNGALFFVANDGDHGSEPWKSNLSQGNASLVRDINPNGDCNPESFTAVGGLVAFSADDGAHGRELWRSDGTPANTWMVKDIRADGSGVPDVYWNAYLPRGDFLELSGKLVFVANDGASGYEPWISDLTLDGAQPWVEIQPGPGSACRFGSSLTEANGVVYLAADGGSEGRELWTIDPAGPSASPVKDIDPGIDGSGPMALGFIGNTLFFLADDGVHGYEVWRSDGAEEGTFLVRDVNQAPRSSNPYSMTNLGDRAMLTTQSNPYSLWTSRGTPSSTEMLRRLGDPNMLFTIYPTASNGWLYFVADDPLHGRELWKTDGSVASTTLVRDIWPGIDDGMPQSLTDVNGTLYFTACDSAHGWELWKSNGTFAGTQIVEDINVGGSSWPHDLVNVGGALYFVADDGPHGWQVWTCGAGGISRISSFEPNHDWARGPHSLTDVGGVLYFTAEDGRNGREPWVYNPLSMSATGPRMIRDVNPGSASSCQGWSTCFVAAAGAVYFAADDGAHGLELWRTDGGESGTSLVKDVNPDGNGMDTWTSPVNLGGKILFSANDGRGTALWRTDGTEGGTVLISEVRPVFQATPRDDSFTYAILNGKLYFNGDDGTGSELWQTDGTPQGTVLVDDIWPGPGGSSPGSMAVIGGKLYFAANDRMHGYEPWIFDPTEPDTTDFGDLRFEHRPQQDPTHGDLWYRYRPTLPNSLTVFATFAGHAGDVQLALYDATRSPVPSGLNVSVDGFARLDDLPLVGETYFVRLSGTVHPVDLRVTNQLTFNGINNVSVADSPKDDFLRFQYSVNGRHRVTINDVPYEFPEAPGFNVFFDGGDGWDTAELFGSPGDDWVGLNPGSGNLGSGDYNVGVQDVQEITIDGMGGNDGARLAGSPCNDRLSVSPGLAVLSDADGTAFTNTLLGNFLNVSAVGMGGNDSAQLTGTAGGNWFTGRPQYGQLTAGGHNFEVRGFASVKAVCPPDGAGSASLYDSPRDDVLHAEPTFASLQAGNGSYSLRADNFRFVTAYSTPGAEDRAEFTASSGTDFFTATPKSASMVGPGFNNRAAGFARVFAAGSGNGDDSARLYDSSGNDHLDASPRHAILSGSGFFTQVDAFPTINAYATGGGNDTAQLNGSPGKDTCDAQPTVVLLRDGDSDSKATYRVRASAFDFVGVEGKGSVDTATLHDSPGDDEFHGWPAFAFVQGPGFTNRVDHFRYVTASATAGGDDVARLFGSKADEKLSAQPGFAEMTDAKKAKFSNVAQGFEAMVADCLGGNDTATLSESDTQAMNDTLVAGPGYARLADGVYSESTRQFAGHTYLIEVNNVRTVRATGAQGADMAYLYGSAGDDVFEGRLEFSRLSSAASNKTRFDLKAEAFKQVFLRLGQGAKAKDAVALYDSTGSDTLNAMRNAIELHYPDLNGVKRFINVSGLGRKTPVTATSRKGGRDRVVYAAFPAYPLTLIGPWKKTPRPAHRNTKT